MAGVLVFDIETIPDATGIRRLENIPESISDEEVVNQALALRKEKTGSESVSYTHLTLPTKRIV